MGKSFAFEGVLRVKPGKKKKRVQELLDRDEAFILYESPFRLLKLLTLLAELVPDQYVMVGREMTKTFEEYIKGSALEVLSTYTSRPSIKGEGVVCVYPKRSNQKEDS